MIAGAHFHRRFCTGYSSLAHLKKLPVSSLKIDASFVSDMTEDENDAIIVRSTVDLAPQPRTGCHRQGVGGPRKRWVFSRSPDWRLPPQGIFICRPVPAADGHRMAAPATAQITPADITTDHAVRAGSGGSPWGMLPRVGGSEDRALQQRQAERLAPVPGHERHEARPAGKLAQTSTMAEVPTRPGCNR